MLERNSDLLKKSDKYPHVKLVDQIDIEAFTGILYLISAFRLNLQTIWNHESSHDIHVFTATMSENRFKFICRFVAFDDKPTGAHRWKGDKFACIRELFEVMNIRNGKMRYPSALLAIDETLILTVAALASNNITPINLLSMVCCTEVFVMPLYRTTTSAYHMQANQKSLREMRRNTILQELRSIQNT